jgi:hypothetical protein
MILSRLSDALKTQNWLAVIVEFLIVLAGVVIGFQISAWNEDRAATADYRDALAEIERQIRADIAEIDYQLGRIAEVRALAEDVFPALEACRTPDGGVPALNRLIVLLANDVVPTYETRGVSRLLGSERLRARADEAALAALERYDAAMAEENSQLSVNFQLLWAEHVLHHPVMTANLDPQGEEASFALDVPLGEACADRTFKRRLAVTHAFYATIGLRMTDFRVQAEDALAAVTRAA